MFKTVVFQVIVRPADTFGVSNGLAAFPDFSVVLVESAVIGVLRAGRAGGFGRGLSPRSVKY